MVWCPVSTLMTSKSAPLNLTCCLHICPCFEICLSRPKSTYSSRLLTYLPINYILLRKFYFLSWILLEIKKSLRGQQNMINAMAKFLTIHYLPMKLSVIWKSVWGSGVLIFLGQHFKWTIFSVVDWGNNCCCL